MDTTATWIVIGVSAWLAVLALFVLGLVRMAGRKRPTPFDAEPDDGPAVEEAAAVEDKAA